MGRMDRLKGIGKAAAAKVAEADIAKVAGDAVVGAAGVMDGVEAVAGRSGLLNKKGEVSKLKVARAALQPTKTARTVIGAAAEEIQARRGAGQP